MRANDPELTVVCVVGYVKEQIWLKPKIPMPFCQEIDWDFAVPAGMLGSLKAGKRIVRR
jgi:hypothetical protein